MDKSKLEYINNVKTLNDWSKAYYVDNDPVATDKEYDELYSQVKLYEKTTGYVAISSPTNRVGESVVNGFSKEPHKNRMWSMEDAFTKEDIVNWLKNKPECDMVAESKYDGLSLNLVYKDGVLTKAITRGDGLIGEDVLANARTLQTIPLEIVDKTTMEIRGEVVLGFKDFILINEELEKLGKKPYINPRNAAAGILRQHNMSELTKGKLQFIPWDIKDDSQLLKLTTHSKKMEYLNTLGFINNKGYKVSNIDEIETIYKKMHEDRKTSDIGLDGMVIKIDDSSLFESIGYTNKFPKGMIAYKFEAVEVTTKVLSVKLQVGRTGVITPVAILTPTFIDGSTVEKVTLHNFEDIRVKDIRINDTVTLIKSGDIIPKIIKVFKDRRDETVIPIPIPTECPTCTSTLVNKEGIIKCPNLSCPDRIISSIVHYASRDHLYIDGLGVKVVEMLVKNNLVSKFTDLYKLDREKLSKLDGFADKKITNLLQGIENSKGCDIDKFLSGLGVENIGKSVSKMLSKKYGKGIFTLTKDELLSNRGIGDVIAESFYELITNNNEMLGELMELVKPVFVEAKVGRYENLIFVLSGTMSKPRNEIVKDIEAEGGTVKNSVTRETTYLVTEETTGKKYETAMKLNIPIITEQDL